MAMPKIKMLKITKIAKIVRVVREDEVLLHTTPTTRRWEIDFDLTNDRGRVIVFKIAVRNLTCVLRYTCREAIFKK